MQKALPAAAARPESMNRWSARCRSTDEEIERLHPKGKEYVTAMLEYDIADFEHDTGEISDAAFSDIKDKVKELEEWYLKKSKAPAGNQGAADRFANAFRQKL